MLVIQDTEKDSGVDALSVMEGLENHPNKPDQPPTTPPSNQHPLRRVGYTIDMSINLGNASHNDVHDASQGFSVWTEELRGVGYNWFVVMPNVYGRRPDGSTFSGIAIKLLYGVAISWDGRVLRHCTSLSHPDGRPDRENPAASPRVSSDCICMETSPVQRRGLCKPGEPALLGLSLSKGLWRLMAMLKRLSHTMLTKLQQQLMQLHHS
jgi:hypothetical protein